ncbi:MAG: DUF1778 domain-containing protein [Bifidobacteriaceae bacterium]|nr:DUF1778 domain-containing protein [Bifidobacteriaceae bacterium]
MLAQRQWFVVSDERFAEFQRLLDEPVASTPRFGRLFLAEPLRRSGGERRHRR